MSAPGVRGQQPRASKTLAANSLALYTAPSPIHGTLLRHPKDSLHPPLPPLPPPCQLPDLFPLSKVAETRRKKPPVGRRRTIRRGEEATRRDMKSGCVEKEVIRGPGAAAANNQKVMTGMKTQDIRGERKGQPNPGMVLLVKRRLE
ncbi:hypothetical protein EYF80_013924 [Liparis tanakae]|uniref:Uncharacterized protein n=1 Tax=Liparis tanakae TaxID=230148 RepID=A0A4Z2ID05_9TELE|nr:hypothetical protein EYF80_013924 [Liparis tanakae]